MRLICAILSGLLAVTGCAILRRPIPEPEAPPPEIAEHIPSHRAFDHRPYELIWTDRLEDHGPLIDFEGLMGWTVEADPPVRASFGRSQDKQLWGLYVGKLSYLSTSRTGRVVARPPAPLPIPEYFTAVNLWVYGAPSIADHPVDIHALVTDASGAAVRLPLARVEESGWALVNRRFPGEPERPLRHPFQFDGLEFGHLYAPEGAELFIDSLAFYTETFHALPYPSRLRRSIPPGPGQSTGFNTGDGTLPFPVRAQSVMPEPAPLNHPAALSRMEQGGFRFSYEMDGVPYAYEIKPDEGPSSLQLLCAGERIAVPVYGAHTLASADSPRRVVVQRVDRDELFVEYDDGLRCQLALAGHVLRIDISQRGGRAEGLDLGGLRTTSPARRLSIPYLASDPGYSPSITLITPMDGASLFVGVYPDWYRSNASEWTPGESETSALAHGVARYHAVHRGRRNDLYERIYVAASPRLEDVLPVTPNPEAARASEAAARIWVDADGPESYAGEGERLRGLFALGMTNVLYVAGPTVWSEGDDSRSFRDRAAPRRGGDAQFREFAAALADMGWRAGAYMNVRDLSPINRHWSPDRIQRASDGNWKPGPDRTYAARPIESLMLGTNIARALAEKFPLSALYLDAHGERPPWSDTDYDNRVPGAGGYLSSYYLTGELMMALSESIRGPVAVSDRHAWMYAGFADGLMAAGRSREPGPYLPVFKLTRLHGLSAFYGPPFDMNRPDEAAADHYVAAQIAYGNSGRIPADSVHPARLYYLMLALQRRYALRMPERISYWNGTAYAGVSEALMDGTWKRSQLYFLYPGHLEIWVNGSDGETWTIRVGAETWHLPPYGWVAVSPDFLACSALVDGARLDFVESPEYIFFDVRGSDKILRGFSSAGPLVIRESEILNIGGVEEFTVGRSRHLGVEPVGGRAYGPSGERLGEIAVSAGPDRWRITCPPGTYRIELE